MTHFPPGHELRRRLGRITLTPSRPATRILIAVLVLILLPALARAQQQPKIEWELVNPFRFIHDQNTIDELKTVFDSTDKSAAGLEKALQDKSDKAVQQVRAIATHCDSPSPAEKRQCFAPYSGWFAKVAENNYANTCWDWEHKKYRRDGPCADYIYPSAHRVRVWVANSESLGDVMPQWTVDPAPTSAPTPCDAKYGKRFCIEFPINYQPDNLIEVRVSAQFPNVTLMADPNIKVKDLFIVGLGDSYAAGEGNPDIPATFVDSDLDSGRHKDWFAGKLADHKTNQYPQKEREAMWLDKRCHRSMYSYQFKTALQLALANPKQAVTFVSFSCSGAVTGEIIDESQKAKEKDETLPPKERDELKPQLEALRDTVKSDSHSSRTIDYLLLSTGGNDVGFANYVAFILVRQKLLLEALSLFRGVSEHKMKKKFERHQFELDLLGTAGEPGNYVQLQNALMNRGTQSEPNPKVRGCQAGAACARIILTPYPNVLTDENEQPCNADRLEFIEFFGVDNRVPRISMVKQYVFDQITEVQGKVHGRLGWTVVDGNVDSYLRHGFCSRNVTSQTDGEKFQVPTWLNNDWSTFNPRQYKAYESRFRWFRLPVDSVLTTDQARVINGEQKHVLLEYARSNIMHPTAEGLARTADLNVAKIKELQKDGN